MATEFDYRVASDGVRSILSLRFGRGAHKYTKGSPAGVGHAWAEGAPKTVCGRLVQPAAASPLHLFPDVHWTSCMLDSYCPDCNDRVPRR